jgi:hypothetical protein
MKNENTERNEKLYAHYLANEKYISYAQLGREFNISRQYAREVVERMKHRAQITTQ